MTDRCRSHFQQLYVYPPDGQKRCRLHSVYLKGLSAKSLLLSQTCRLVLSFSGNLFGASIFCASVPVCAGFLRSRLASDTDSSTICLPAAQDASVPPTVLMFIDRNVRAKPQKNNKYKILPSGNGTTCTGHINK